MIIGIGVDIVEINRITLILEKHSPAFCRKILSNAEQDYYKNYSPSLIANLLSAKEAFVKAMGTGFRAGISLQYISVIDSVIYYSESIKQILQQKSVKQVCLSSMHNDNFALSIVITET